MRISPRTRGEEWRDDDDLLQRAALGRRIDALSDLAGEMLLFDLVPIGGFDRAARAAAGGETPPRRVCAKIASGGDFFDQRLEHPKIEDIGANYDQ